jgi:isochorismate hydrolase
MISARPFDYPYDGRLDPQAAALVVIDLQEDFLSEDG